MAQVTLYMDDDTLARVRAAAEAAGLSLSAWLTRLARERTRSEWPQEVLALAGAWADFPTGEDLRSGFGRDVLREEI